MRVRSLQIIAVGLAALCGVASLVQARESLPAPISIEVTLAGDGPTQRVAGKLTAFDDAGITISVGERERVLKWDELVPGSAFTVKFRLIDKSVASQWMELGRWGWAHGLAQQSRSAFGNARKLDKSLGAKIDAILAQPPGSVAATDDPVEPTTMPAEPAAPGAAAPAPSDEDTTAMQPGYRAGEKLIRYTTPTAEENAASIEQSRKRMAEAEKTVEAKFVEIETAHFLIFTDWDVREHGFLKGQCEGAYNVLARQFRQPISGNVFVGKLPIYMFKSQKDFLRFARDFDDFGAGETLLGYFVSSSTEMGHMAMWKPGVGTGIGEGGSKDLAMRNWARTLLHEFTHAFIHRYKSNARIPRWLNEGTAEMISEATLPTNNYRGRARTAAQDHADVMPLFDDSNMPGGYYYPVMMTLAECLQKQDPKKFLLLFDEIKDGTEPEKALQKIYAIDYNNLAVGWSAYAKGLK